MGYQATSTAGTEKIILTNPDYWVEIYTCLSRKALRKAEGALSRATVRAGADGADEATMTPDVSEYRDLMLLGSLAAWNLDDDNGQVLPINAENAGLLSGPDFARIYARVDALNSPVKGEEAKRFPDQGAGSDLP